MTCPNLLYDEPEPEISKHQPSCEVFALLDDMKQLQYHKIKHLKKRIRTNELKLLNNRRTKMLNKHKVLGPFTVSKRKKSIVRNWYKKARDELRVSMELDCQDF